MKIDVSNKIYSPHVPLVQGMVPDHFQVQRPEGVLRTSFWHIARMAAIRDAEEDHMARVTAHFSVEMTPCA